MYVEDGGDADQVQMIEGPVQFVLEGMTSGIYFLMKPFPWDASNLLQIIQSFENLAIAGLLVLLARAAWNRAPRMLIFWTLFLIFAASIYGLVVFNYALQPVTAFRFSRFRHLCLRRLPGSFAVQKYGASRLSGRLPETKERANDDASITLNPG